ncbi:type VI secretion system baseplate protein IglJ [Francisella-like endosymbiont]|uniref:type VI secretion system baseplate protein IglJ n=1 Tax=Francisella-like endosymbiont TaxID=512373 RepID=UPI00296E815D
MKYINNINKNISLNNFISFLKNQKYPLEKIKLIPVPMDNLSSSTILDIYEDQETLNVKINIFKIKPFAKLQSMYQEYIQNNNSLAIQVLEYGIKILLNIYILDNKMLYKLTQENTYIQSTPKHTIDSIINSLYKLLSEDYCTVINYTEKPVNIQRKQRLIGHSSVGNTFLGGNMPSIIYKYQYIPS